MNKILKNFSFSTEIRKIYLVVIIIFYIHVITFNRKHSYSKEEKKILSSIQNPQPLSFTRAFGKKKKKKHGILHATKNHPQKEEERNKTAGCKDRG